MTKNLSVVMVILLQGLNVYDTSVLSVLISSCLHLSSQCFDSVLGLFPYVYLLDSPQGQKTSFFYASSTSNKKEVL